MKNLDFMIDYNRRMAALAIAAMTAVIGLAIMTVCAVIARYPAVIDYLDYGRIV